MQVRVPGFNENELRFIREVSFENKRTVWLEGPIDYEYGVGSARVLFDQIMYLNDVDSTKPIKLFIDSPGGYLAMALRVHDVIRASTAPVWTVCAGTAASGASLILACGKRGKRFAFPNAHVMFHLPEGTTQGDAKEVKIQSKFFEREKNNFLRLLADHTGKSLKLMTHDIDRLHFLDAEAAKKYGFVDNIIINISQLSAE